MTYSKPFYLSKTLWFNVIAFTLMVAVPVLGQFGYTGEVPAEWTLFVAPAIALVNLVLRFITKQPLG